METLSTVIGRQGLLSFKFSLFFNNAKIHAVLVDKRQAKHVLLRCTLKRLQMKRKL